MPTSATKKKEKETERPLCHANVIMTQHAIDRMSERGYCLRDVEMMLGKVDPRLVIEIITILPRTAERDGADLRVKSQLKAAELALEHAETKRQKKRWRKKINKLQKALKNK